jgi:hypothetical protein
MLIRYTFFGVMIALESSVSTQDQHISVYVKDLTAT